MYVRLEKTTNLVEVTARYHSTCMLKFYVKRVSDQIGRPASQSTIDFIPHAINYIENNGSESQFSLNEIKEEFDGNVPDLQTIKSKLTKHFTEVISLYFSQD